MYYVYCHTGDSQENDIREDLLDPFHLERYVQIILFIFALTIIYLNIHKRYFTSPMGICIYSYNGFHLINWRLPRFSYQIIICLIFIYFLLF